MRFQHFLLLALIFVLFTKCTRYVWQSKGPHNLSGAIQYIMFDPAHENKLYAAAENGGVWVLNDVTNTNNKWQPLSDKLPNLQMRGLAKSAYDDKYIVAGTMDGHIYHTKDHGVSWQQISNDDFGYIRKLSVSIGLDRVPAGNYTRLAKLTVIHVAGSRGYYRVRLINDSFSEIDTLYNQGDVTDLAIGSDPDAFMFIGVRDTGLLRSTNNGNSWRNIMSWSGTRVDNTSSMIKVTLSSDNKRAAVKMGRHVYINDNAKTDSTWTKILSLDYDLDGDGPDDGTGSDVGYRGSYTNKEGDWNHTIAISPVDKNVIMVGQMALYRSSSNGSGGFTWDSLGTWGHEDAKSIAFRRDGSTAFYANDGGVFRYNINSSTNTKSMNNGLATYQFYRMGVKGSSAVGCADHNGIKGTINLNAAEPDWIQANKDSSVSGRRFGFGNNGLENNFVYADPVRTNRYYVIFTNSLLRLRFDGAPQFNNDLLSFSDTSTANRLRPYQSKDFNSLDSSAKYNRLNYAVGTIAVDTRSTSQTILSSVHINRNRSFGIRITKQANNEVSGTPPDRGNGIPELVANAPTWTLSFGPSANPIASIAFSKAEPGRVYAIDEAGQVITKKEVNDDAEPWRIKGTMLIDSGDFARQIALHNTSSNKVFAIAHRQFAISVDSGATWTRTGQGLPDVKLNSICIHPTKSRTLFIGTDRGVYSSTDGGNNWSLFGEGLPNAPTMQVFVESNYLYAVTFGRGLWRVPMLKKKTFFAKGS